MTDSRRRTALEAAVTASMLRVFDKVQRSRRLARDYGTGDRLTMVEAEVCQLIDSLGSVSPSELAERTGVSRPAISQALNKMRVHGLVSVESAPGNGKARVVRLTDAGARVAAGVNAMHREMAAAVYADSADDHLEAHLGLFERLDSYFAQVIHEERRR
ncbi:MarR family winged helix-turn-helix transcriptional regulator [Gordonia aurantiaca]|uniref:MarR family winged helix-turn-helix transcriptional regulator n=1 Tax=Gordonia sp. B21 TaxID=3151852 RepID=UPI0032654AF6